MNERNKYSRQFLAPQSGHPFRDRRTKSILLILKFRLRKGENHFILIQSRRGVSHCGGGGRGFFRFWVFRCGRLLAGPPYILDQFYWVLCFFFLFLYIWVKGAFLDSRPPFAEYRSNCYLEDIFLIADRKDYLFFMGIKRSFSFQ